MERGADLRDIKRAFRRLALEFHPDRASGEADRHARAERFKLIGIAFGVLSDVDTVGPDGKVLIGKRTLYDRGELELDDDPFEPEPEPVPGADQRCDLPVSFWAAVHGGRVELTTPRGRAVVVVLQPGAHHHQQLRLRGHGGPGSPAGDLVVRLVVGTDPDYTREGDELHRVLRVTWLEAWRGDLLEVSTPWGSVGLELHAGVANGQVYEVLAHGVRRPERWGPLRLRIALQPPPAREQLPPAVAEALVDALRAAYDAARP